MQLKDEYNQLKTDSSNRIKQYEYSAMITLERL